MGAKAITAFLIVMILGTIGGYYGYNYFLETREYIKIEEKVFSSVDIHLAAVTEDDVGMLIPMRIEIHQGSGKILVNIDDPSFIIDTQDSMRIAVHEASRVTQYNTAGVDVLFSLDTGVTIVGGPSAGAAMAVATAASLINKNIRQDIIITGTIEDGGKIGPVGGIILKAQAAKAYGATIFLVPDGESVIMQEIEECDTEESFGWEYEHCTVRYESTSVSEVVPGLQVIEVSYIEDALQYMLTE